jgi:hypothetical protein
MNRHLISIGVALVDAGARPDVIRWIIDLLGSGHRAYLPLPKIALDEPRKTLVQFRVDSRALILIAVRPRVGSWVRLGPHHCVDHGTLGGPGSGDTVVKLIEWLLDGHDLDQVEAGGQTLSIR